MRFHVITFGCQMNAGDSAWLSRALRSQGWEEAVEADAQVILVNTCSVRKKPEEKVYSLLGRLAPQMAARAADAGGFVAVGGCVAQQLGGELCRRYPFVRLVFGADGLAGVPAAARRLADDPRLTINLTDFTQGFVERRAAWPDERVPPVAHVTIMQGCDNFCAYCIVPFVRGRQKSRAADAVVDECRQLIDRGVVEIQLLGQNVNSYGQDAGGQGVDFAALLRRVAALPGLARLRFTTSHPKDLSPRVIAAFGDLGNLCPQLHLPLQSGSDAVLARMGRKYDLARYLGLVRDLRAARPDMALTTDLIVGFPGETEGDFARTLEAMETVRFAQSFSFVYSDRPGTAAQRMDGKLPADVKARRLAELQALQERLTVADLEAQAGRDTTVLIEGRSKRQDAPGGETAGGLFWRGRDPGGRVVNLRVPVGEGGNPPADLTGTLVGATIRQAKKHSLLADALEPSDGLGGLPGSPGGGV